MATVVRAAEIGDINELTEIMYEYIVDFYQRPKPPVENVQNLIRTLLRKEDGIQFVAQKEGNIVGFATLYFTYSTTRADRITVMNDLYVIEQERGKNVASQLFQACRTYSNDHHYACMTWVTASDNKRAQRFYEKMGGVRGDWLNYSIV